MHTVRPGACSATLSALALIVSALGVVLSLCAAPTANSAPAGSVLVTRVDGPITAVVADHLAEGVRRAEADKHEAFLLELDTPGGVDASMRDIVQTFLAADVPVIVYVTPSGARAASAGALITLSAHRAAMAPGTTIGAATPVRLEGDGDVERKVIEDAAAFAVSVAQQRGRNVEFAEDIVREGRAVSAPEAVELSAVDLLAADRAELLRAVDGDTVVLGGGTETTLRTANAPVVDHEMGVFTSLRQVLANPTIAFLLISLGGLALIFELANPGVGVGGVIGVVMLALGFVSLAVLPVQVAGVLLVVLALALFAAELFTPGIGAFAGGGAIALAAAGLMLFEGPFEVDPFVLWPTAVVVGAGTALAGRLALRARKAAPITGDTGMIGQHTVVDETDGHNGRAQLDGAWWELRGRDQPLHAGQRVRVVDVDSLTLIVEAVAQEEK